MLHLVSILYALARRHALRIIVTHFPHLRDEVGSRDQPIGRIPARQDDLSLGRQIIEQGLDRDEEDFDLEVGSAGIGQPFKVLQQYEIHLGDEVEILTTTGKKLQGRLTAASAEEISIVQQVKVKAEGEKRPHLEEVETKLPMSEVKWTKLYIDFK